jgi:hypothetical protein
MVEKRFTDHEKESCLGLSTLELAKRVMGSIPSIQNVQLSAHYRIPHSPIETERLSYVSRDVFFAMQQKDFDALAQSYGDKWHISLGSRVSLADDKQAHLITTDLDLSKSEENLALIKKRFNEIIKPKYGGGFILETGKSYQFFGIGIVGENEWYSGLLASFLMTSIVKEVPQGMVEPHILLVDDQHIGHSMSRGHTCVRLTTRAEKEFTPFVKDYI